MMGNAGSGLTPSVRLAVIVLAIAALSVVFTSSALAGKGGGGGGGKPPRGGGGGSISLVLLNSTDGQAHYGQTVTFNVSTTATSEPWVNLKCYQSGVLVAEGWNGYFDASLTGRNFGLY